ncbi:unnamed protein product, partial [marine sediment metagenome]
TTFPREILSWLVIIPNMPHIEILNYGNHIN